MKRVFLLAATNLGILVMPTLVARLLGLDRWLAGSGMSFGALKTRNQRYCKKVATLVEGLRNPAVAPALT